MDDLTGDDDIPSYRADPEISRGERVKLSITVKGPAGVSGQVDFERQGSDRSLTARATTMMMVVAVACLAAVTIAVVCKLAEAPSLLLALGAIAAFAGVLIAGTIISFRRDSKRSQPEVTHRPGVPFRSARQARANGNAQALSREAHQNGHGTKKGQKRTTGPQGEPAHPNQRHRV